MNDLKNFLEEVMSMAAAAGLDIKDLHAKIGNLDNLNTEDKTSLVNSINEIIGDIAAINGRYIPLEEKSSPNGVAPLNGDGIVPTQYLPGTHSELKKGKYINETTFHDENGNVYTPEDTVLYIDVDSNLSYRWTGSSYIPVGDGGVVLGTTSETAGRGDHAKIAYDHSQLNTSNPHRVTKSDVGLGNVENYKISTDDEAKLGSTNEAYATPHTVKTYVDDKGYLKRGDAGIPVNSEYLTTFNISDWTSDTDYNDLIQHGFYSKLMGSTCSNRPSDDFYYVEVFRYNHASGIPRILQYAYPYRADVEDIYIRSKLNETWSPWVKVYTSKNFGKSEIDALGIDATTLEGKTMAEIVGDKNPYQAYLDARDS